MHCVSIFIEYTKISNFCWFFFFQFHNLTFCPCVGNVEVDSWPEFLLQPLHIWHNDTSRWATKYKLWVLPQLQFSTFGNFLKMWMLTLSLWKHQGWLSVLHFLSYCAILLSYQQMSLDWMDQLTHCPLDKMAAISQTTCSNAFSWMKIFEFQIKFLWNVFFGV